MSFIETMSRPLAAKDLMADSLPEPTPLTRTSTLSIPNLFTVKVIASAALEAAKGVDYFDPLNQSRPALVQAKIFPLSSVKVKSVLL